MQSSVGRRLGDGGTDLRWSLDGREVVWLKPQPGDFWAEMVRRADEGQTREGEQRPARPEGAMWSPDGLWCAAATGQGDSKQLVICRSGSPKGETVKLPGAPVKQLLGWSPDSSMLLVLSANNQPLAVSIQQLPDDAARLLSTEGAMFSPERATIAGWPTDLRAGPPSWSSTGTLMLAYVAARYPTPREVSPYGEENEDLAGSLVVQVVKREYLGPPEQLAYNIERKQLLSNMKHVALALQMYFTDYDVYPLAQGTEQLMDARFGVDEYIGSDTYYMRPGVKGEVAVKYLVPPGASASWFRENGVEAKYAAIAIIDYHPDYFVVAYADGHVEELDRREWEFDGTALRRR
jgi:prepilin-type processing-associated H-X9-DG protein